MENRINLEEMILKKLDDTFDKKSRFETKASIYIAVVSVILSAIFDDKFQNQIFGKIAVIIGLIALVLCMLIIFPREFNSLELDDILKIQSENPNDSYEQILKKVKCKICKNQKKLYLMGQFSKLSSIFLMLLIADFVIAYLQILIA